MMTPREVAIFLFGFVAGRGNRCPMRLRRSHDTAVRILKREQISKSDSLDMVSEVVKLMKEVTDKSINRRFQRKVSQCHQ